MSSLKSVESSTERNQQAAKWSTLIAGFAGLLIVAITLFPYNFSLDSELLELSLFKHPSDFFDLGGNVLLFLPFGFGLAGSLQRSPSKISTGLIVTAAGLLLSAVIELLQLLLPSRFTSFIDLLTNGAGTSIGCLCFFVVGNSLLSLVATAIEHLKKILSVRLLAGCFVGYIVLLCFGSLPLLDATRLTNWDDSFHLLFGNEGTGDRPWQGAIETVSLSDRALSSTEVDQLLTQQQSLSNPVVLYQFNQSARYRDLIGTVSALEWQGTAPTVAIGQPIPLGADYWLKTTSPAIALSQRLSQSSRFTLDAIITTANSTQTGPARIVSLSEDVLQRNFTLGQSADQLIFRLRTPVTGDNGGEPQLVFPGVFETPGLHHIVVTYTGSILTVYVDQVQQAQSLEIVPWMIALRGFAPPDIWSMELARIFYYLVAFFPLGVLLHGIIKRWQERRFLNGFLWLTVIVLPALLLEGLLAASANRPIFIKNIGLSVAIATLTLLFLKFREARQSKLTFTQT